MHSLLYIPRILGPVRARATLLLTTISPQCAPNSLELVDRADDDEKKRRGLYKFPNQEAQFAIFLVSSSFIDPPFLFPAQSLNPWQEL